MHCKFHPRELCRVDLCGPVQSLTVSDSADVVHRGYDGLMATPRETEPLVPKSGSLIFILVQSGLVVMISRVFINLHLESKARGCKGYCHDSNRPGQVHLHKTDCDILTYQ